MESRMLTDVPFTHKPTIPPITLRFLAVTPTEFWGATAASCLAVHEDTLARRSRNRHILYVRVGHSFNSIQTECGVRHDDGEVPNCALTEVACAVARYIGSCENSTCTSGHAPASEHGDYSYIVASMVTDLAAKPASSAKPPPDCRWVRPQSWKRIAKPRKRANLHQFAGRDEAAQHRRRLASVIAPEEGPVVPSDREAPQRRSVASLLSIARSPSPQ